MVSITQPEDLNNLLMVDAYCFYRDLGWHDLPVYPPWAKVKDPGKQPAFEKWWDVNPHDCNLDKYFNNERPYNIGLAPTNGVVVVDLDSKPDKGVNVQALLNERPDLAAAPRHATRNGAHLVYSCSDLPPFTHPNGWPYHKALMVEITPQVTAELFHSNHTNVVLPPSRHKDDDFIYRWIVFGEIPVVTWKWLQDTFGFRDPREESQARSRKGARDEWHLQFRGDLASLDLVKVFEELGSPPLPANADEGKYSVPCPWNTEHSEKDTAAGSTSTVIWQPGDDNHWPGFDCKHSHCAKRRLKDVLELAEAKTPGIVDRHCARLRVYDRSAREHLGKRGLPRVLHAEGRLESAVYKEVGKIIAPHHVWFNRGGWITYIEKVPSGFEYSANPKMRYKVTAFSFGFRELTALRAKGMLEGYMEPGVLRLDENGEEVFVPKSFVTEFCAGMVQSDQLRDPLDHISRILSVPLPLHIGNELVYPKKGFDPRFGTYLVPDSPELDHAMPINEAWELIAKIFSGFCFTNEQSRTHAVARLLTPFAHALLGWTTRVPLWAFIGSRPRCGKDYLSGCVLIIYEGSAFEDQPITGRDSAPETGKRILAAARAGRRFMHFSNCEQRIIKDTSLIQAITNQMLSGRNLGTNDAKSDITVPNEIEFSVSFNLGVSIAEDLGPRARPISMAFYEEDPNSRTFPNPHLHETLKKERTKILSAFAAVFKVWAKAGFPKGPTPFTSFVDWAEIIGGIMFANRQYMYAAFDPLPGDGTKQLKFARPPEGWGDPCLPWNDEFAESVADRRSAAMSALFIVCRKDFGDTWVKNKDIIDCIAKYQASLGTDDDEGEKAGDDQNPGGSALSDAQLDALSYFGHLDQGDDAHRNKGNLVRALRAFRNRILAGIQLRIKPNSNRIRRDLYQFFEVQKPPTTPETAATVDKTPESGIDTTPQHENRQTAPTTAETPQKLAPWPHSGSILPVYGGANPYHTPGEKKGEGSNIIRSCTVIDRHFGATWSHGATSESYLALDLETYAEPKIGRKGRITATGDALDPFKGEIRLVTLANPDGNISQFDLRKTQALPAEICVALACEELVIHNAAFELRFLATKFGLWPQRVFCTLTASRLLEPLKSVPHALGSVLERHLDVKLLKEHGSSDWGAFVLTECQMQNARDDVRYLHRLRLVLASALLQEDLALVFDLEMALLPIITRMELHGFSVDVERLKTLLPEQRSKAQTCLEGLRDAFGKPDLNANSPEQVLEVFKAAGIELVKSNPDGSKEETTEEELLCTIDDPRAEMLLEYRKADKLAVALAALLEVVREDGRICAQFNPLGAATGRFSSKNPNLQQVPKKGAKHVRAIFVPGGPDRRLIVADYSQIELRVAALVAGETVMIDAFREAIDLHAKIAAASLRIAAAQVTRAQRDIGKTVNFGFLYGRSAEGYRRGVRKDYGLILASAEAAAYRKAFFTAYPAIAAWHEDCRRKAKDSGNDRAHTIFGRLLCAQADNSWARFNLLTNYVVQGSCADLLKMAMIKIAAILHSDVHLVATVHDELIYDAREDLALESCDMIRMAMEETFVEMFGTTVPIVAEAKVCKNWGEK
jgi:DNA polymerase I-like protein with 3'-5' exonuclease and polymerase domains